MRNIDELVQTNSRLILPPLPITKQSKQTTDITQLFSVITQKRKEYQQSIQKYEPVDSQQPMRYVRNQIVGNANQSLPENKAAWEEEKLARGSHQYSLLRQLPIKRKQGMNKEYSMTIEPIGKKQDKSIMTQMIIEKGEENEGQRESYKIVRNRFYSEPVEKVRDIEETTQKSQTKQKEKEMHVFEPKLGVSSVVTQTKPKKEYFVREDYNVSPIKKLAVNRFLQLALDLKNTGKTNERLQRMAKSLQNFNPLFRKLQRVVSVCLLRVGKIKHKSANNILYQIDQPHRHFFIILTGVIKIYGRNGMHKLCEAGQTVLQEIVVEQSECPVALQKAKVTEDGWMLQVGSEDLLKLYKELKLYGFKQGLNQLKSLIKRNFVVKSWLRNKFKLLSKV